MPGCHEPLSIGADTYYAAWRQRDSSRLRRALGTAASYEDPTTPGPLTGDAAVSHIEALWAQLPELVFELGECHAIGDRTLHVEWHRQGTHVTPLDGLPPTGAALSLSGLDVIRLGADGAIRVRSHYDTGTLPRQLGLTVSARPERLGPIDFGNSIVVRRDRPALPGIVAFTEMQASAPEHVPELLNMSRQILIENLANPAMHSFTASVAGTRMTTFSAWSSQDALAAAMHQGTHVVAMQRFFRDGVVRGGSNGLYAPHRIGPWWSRCEACGAMARLDAPEGECSKCGAAVDAVA